MQVDSLNRAEFFGEVSITKSPIAPTTAVASNVTTTVLVISKYVLHDLGGTVHLVSMHLLAMQCCAVALLCI